VKQDFEFSFSPKTTLQFNFRVEQQHFPIKSVAITKMSPASNSYFNVNDSSSNIATKTIPQTSKRDDHKSFDPALFPSCDGSLKTHQPHLGATSPDMRTNSSSPKVVTEMKKLSHKKHEEKSDALGSLPNESQKTNKKQSKKTHKKTKSAPFLPSISVDGSKHSKHHRNSSEPINMTDISVMGRFLSIHNKKKHKNKGQSKEHSSSSPESVGEIGNNKSSAIEEIKQKESSDVNDLSANHTYDIVLRSSELEPSLHQVELPSCADLLVYARLCSVAESYREIDQNFDFSNLVGQSRLNSEQFSRGSAPFSLSNSDNTDLRHYGSVADSERSIMQSVFECTEDLVLESFFYEGSEEYNRVEVAVFSSQRLRQIIVSYRGPTELQLKPVKTKHTKQKEEGGGVSILHPDQPAPVNPIFRDSYFTNKLEEQVFTSVNDLTSQNPFFDVVTTGHSFGAALATIGALRYALASPMIRVSCHAFGSPRIGGVLLRQLVNSLPNLRVMRIELDKDPWVLMPEGSKWDHVGHSIVISLQSSPSASNDKDKKKISSPSVVAYRFKNRQPSGGGHFWMSASKKDRCKYSHDIRNYVHGMEQFTNLKLPWAKSYEGEEGGGVTGLSHERRHLV